MKQARAERRAKAAASRKPSPGSRFGSWFWVIPFLAAVAIYAPTVGFEFVWDDVTFIEGNPAAHSWSGVVESLGHGYGWVGDAPSRGPGEGGPEARAGDDALYYRPLVTLLNGMQWNLSGGDPAIFHVLNVLAHGVGSALVALILVSLGTQPGFALLAALLFALHPLGTEAVGWISGRTDVLATVFSLAALWAWLRAGAQKGNAWIAAVWLALALLSKETAFFVGAGLVLLGGRDRRSVPLLAVLAAGFALRTWVLGGLPLDDADGIGSDTAFSWLRPGALFLLYVGRVVVPWRPRMESPLWVDDPAIWVASLGWILLLALLGAAIWAWVGVRRAGTDSRRLGLAIGLGLIAAGLVPVLQWVPIGELYGERFCYLPLAGLAIAVGAAAVPSRVSVPRSWAAAIVVILIPWTVITMMRLPDWRSEFTLFSASVRDVPERARSHANLGSALFLAGQLGEAKAPLSRAVEMDPQNLKTRAQLGALLVNLDLPEEGLPHLEAAAAEGTHDRGVLFNLGIARFRAGDLRGAEDVLARAAALYPQDVPTLEALSSVARKDGRSERAVELLEQARTIDPSRKSLYLNLIGVLFYELEDPERARPVMEDFLRRFPRSPEAPPTQQLLRSLDSPAP